MSGWLGTINYGVITANKVDRFLREKFGSNKNAGCKVVPEKVLG